MLNNVVIYARDLPDAWFQCVGAVLDCGRVWTIEHGSYEGQKRWELEFVSIHISHPSVRPLIPDMPPHLSHVPPPTTMDYVYDYLPYLMENQPLKKNEQYTYGQRIKPQMDAIIKRYLENGFGSNQECIAVARPEDIELSDPPCLRQIDTRIYKDEKKLHFYIYLRSWDLWNGFPPNLAAIVLMQEYMADELGIQPGVLVAQSKGLHLYDHAWDIAKLRTGWKDEG